MKTRACALLLLVFVLAATTACRRAAETAQAPPEAVSPTTESPSVEVPTAEPAPPTATPTAVPPATPVAPTPAPAEWVFPTKAEVFSSPALSPDGSTIYFGGMDYNVYALDTATGETRWTFETGDQVVSSPALDGETLYAGSLDGQLYALDAAAGELRWQTPLGLIVSSPAVADGVVYVAAFTPDEQTGGLAGAVVALNAADGAELWRYPVNGPIVSSPEADGGVVYSGGPEGALALDAATGELLWQSPIGLSQSSPALDETSVYIGNEENSVFALDRETGEERWRFTADAGFISTPRLADGLVYIGGMDGNVYALDAADGSEVWRLATLEPTLSSPLLSGGVLYIGSGNGRLYALDAATGELEWFFQTGDAIWSSPLADEERVYIGSFDHAFYALDRSGPQLAADALPQPTSLPPQPTPLPDAPPVQTMAGDGQLPWWNDRVFYEVFVRSFADSDGDGIGDFRGLIDKLDYLNDGDPATTDDLGVTGVWLMPIAQSPSYHGYDVTDYYTVEEDYGTNEDFRTFLEEAHKRGIAVIIDLVMNHSSNQHPWFTEARKPGSPRETWYIWDATPDFWTNPWGGVAWHQDGLRYYFGMFWEGMPDLNYRNGEVTAKMYDILAYWLEEMDVDGYRLDAVRHLIEDGEVQANTPETHAWLKGFHDYVHTINPDALMVGEVWDTSEAVVPYVGDELNIAFEFDVAGAIVDSVLIKNSATLYKTWNNVLSLYPEGQYAPFLTNHDQDRVMSRLRNDVDAAKVAASLYLTAPGVPFLYYGEEIGQVGVKPDEDIRRPMAWDDTPLAGFTTGEPWRPLPAGHEERNVAVESADPGSLLNHYRALIRLRNEHAALRTGSMTMVESDSPRLAAYLRAEGDEIILVLVNLDDEPVSGYSLSAQRTALMAEGPLSAAAGATLLMGEGQPAAPEVNAAGGFDAYTPLPELPPRSTTVINLGS